MKREDQKGVLKSTSLQAWGEMTEKYFGKKLRIEERKDRGAIYSLLRDYKIPHERFYTFDSGDEVSKNQFLKCVGDLGFPYWISATPKLGVKNLDRLSKLRLESSTEGWKFIKDLPRLSDYKLIVMQYADEPVFKGSGLVSKNLNGIVDFVLGDKHIQLTSGLTVSDPLLFSSEKIIRYSKMIDDNYQDEIYSYISKRPGHYEFQYGFLDGKQSLSFFDYNDEIAYEDIDDLFNDLIIYLNGDAKSEKVDWDVKGFPASLGIVKGVCKVIYSTQSEKFPELKYGEVLISDATTPDMTPMMKNAKAIVTDLGGITSHAAIVCRELEIPCIVGCKNATEVLKEGMNIEVNAYKGLVKIIDKGTINVT